jgi:hypothetical protein
MKKKTQIRLAVLLVAAVATIGDVMLRELPNMILADLNRTAPHRSSTRLALAELSVSGLR